MKATAIFTSLLLWLAKPPERDFIKLQNAALSETYVFICDSKTAHVYHSRKDCKGLDACTHEIKKVTLEEAKNNYERRACKVCK